MRILVTGSHWIDALLLRSTLTGLLDECHAKGEQPVLVHGATSRGADAMADRLWRELGLDDLVERHPADWRLGEAAEPIRNLEMVETKPDVVVAFCRGAARDTLGTIEMARDAGLPVRVWRAPR